MHFHARYISGRLRVLAIVLALTLALSAVPAGAATAIYTITAKKVNVRALPDTNADILAVVRQGSELTLLEATDDGWLKVSVGGTVGYVSAEFAELSSVISGGGTLTGVVTTDKLYVRAEPSSKGKSLDLVRRGTMLTITALTGDWFQVSYNGATGYVASDYVRLSGGSGSAPVVAPTLAPTPVPTPAPAVGPTASPTVLVTLKEGSRGDNVKALQQKLIALGYLTGAADGLYGSGTKAAVRAFQSANGLAADGVAGAQTLSAIDRVYAGTASPGVTPSPIGTDTILKKGATGEAVRTLQKYLIQLGYLTGEADGMYGSGTKNAVRAFQAANGLSADGAAGEKTLLAIQNAIAAVSTASTLREGDQGDAVKILQQKLIALGSLSSSADGIFGPSTRSAVQAFQSAHGLTASGIADAATLSAIDKAYQSGNVGGTTIIAPGKVDDGAVIRPGSPVSTYPELKYGDSGSNVTVLQTRLKELGYFNGTVGGNFGMLTQTAVTAFQTAAGLKADGVVGTDTWTALYAANAPAAPSTTLKQGDKNDDVKAMQTRLIQLGYLTGKADGIFGAQTKAAVQAFQTKISYAADGTAGPQTLAALYAETAPKVNETVVAPTIAPSTPIVVNPAPRVARDTDFEKGAEIVALAKKYLGCKYIYAHQSPPYFDCSGLTYYCYKQFGYTLKRTAYAQGYDDTYPKIEKISDLQIGDLIYFNTNETDSDLCDHAAIYVGDGNFIHASSSSGYVLIQSLSTKFYKEHFSWGRRVFNQQ